ncbi:hypothetical protein [Pedobacter sp. JCM 36344]|uniref:hypothetical protein n=1 Tax=Pedobacter sp. JCM 36344 TaxID=3374280 RepID=UPI00397A6A0B
MRVNTQADVPRNLHEYGKIILDLTTDSVVDYRSEDHGRRDLKSHRGNYIECHNPQGLFDPTALILGLLQGDLVNALHQGAMLVVFCSKNETIEYHFSGESDSNSKHNTYSFLPDFPRIDNRQGEILKAEKGKSEIYNLMRKYSAGAKYHVTFSLPQTYIDGKPKLEKNYFPLMFSHDDEVVSFCILDGKSGIFFFPDIEDKGAFLKEFFLQAAPELLPALFPDEAKGKWLEDKRYSMPNQERLETERKEIVAGFEAKLNEKDAEIEQNSQDFSFLKDLLTGTDKVLVEAVIKFLHWLGFDSAIDADTLESESGVLEEDIQIETEKGLIIIEVKGIGGTSTDSECGQIGKVRFRRAKQRGTFDVFPLYIVNHQRHLPAAVRKNPPFNANQISDAENDDRGLLTTWQLFNLFALVERGIITNEAGRECFYQKGYIDFIPKTKKLLGVPKEHFRNNTVVILDLKDEPRVKAGDQLIVACEDEVKQVKVLSVQFDDQEVLESAAGEVGLMLDTPVSKGSVSYV